VIIKTKQVQPNTNSNLAAKASELHKLYETNYKLFKTTILIPLDKLKIKDHLEGNQLELLISNIDLPSINLIIKPLSRFTFECSMNYDDRVCHHSAVHVFPFTISFRVYKDASIIEVQMINDSKNHPSKILNERHYKQTQNETIDKKYAINSVLNQWLNMIQHYQSLKNETK